MLISILQSRGWTVVDDRMSQSSMAKRLGIACPIGAGIDQQVSFIGMKCWDKSVNGPEVKDGFPVYNGQQREIATAVATRIEQLRREAAK